MPAALTIHSSPSADLDARTLHDILQLRSEIFVVEQDCVFLDIDGRDLEPRTEHLWACDDAGRVMSAIRLLHEGGTEWSLGRVVTRAEARAAGVAGRLVSAGVERLDALGAHSIRLHSQAHLAEWYARFGFAVDGPSYVEDGIPHVPMRRHRTAS